MFKKGDKVVVVRASVLSKILQKGDVHIIESCFKNERQVRLVGGDGGHAWDADRFKLVEAAQPSILPFTVGSTVERTGKSHVNVKTGQQYIIETLYKDELGGVEKVKLQGINACYHVRGFKVVAAPRAEQEREFVEGDEVFVVGKDYYNDARWGNNGVIYTIRSIMDHQNAPLYSFNKDVPGPNYIRKESLIFATGPKAEEAKAKMAEAARIKAEKDAIEIAAKLERTKNYKPDPDLSEKLRKNEYGREGGLVSYAFEYRDGSQHFTPNNACHAQLARLNGGVVGQFIYGLHYEVEHKGGDKPHHRTYYNYLLNDSPWAHCYLTKDVDDAMANNVQMNVNVHVNIFAGACVAMRSGTEHGNRAQSFCKFLEKGFLPNTCWLMANAVNWEYNSPSLQGLGGGHDVIDGYRDMDDLVKFFKQGYHLGNSPTNQPICTHSKPFIIAGAIAKHNPDNCFKKWIDDNILQGTVGTGWNAKKVVTDDSVFAAAAKLDNLLKA